MEKKSRRDKTLSANNELPLKVFFFEILSRSWHHKSKHRPCSFVKQDGFKISQTDNFVAKRTFWLLVWLTWSPFFAESCHFYIKTGGGGDRLGKEGKSLGMKRETFAHLEMQQRRRRRFVRLQSQIKSITFQFHEGN